jgi:2-iminobutanoate/2-iminopropanoate deaminase
MPFFAARRMSLVLALAAVPAVPAAGQATREIVPIPGASNPVLSAVVRVGDMLYLSGQLGTVPGQGLVEGGIGPETRQTMENIKRVLEAAGSAMDRVVKCTVFLVDIGDFRAMNEVYRTFFPADPPARSTVAVAGLVLNARIEIECMALAGR